MKNQYVKVRNMESKQGNIVPNQFIIGVSNNNGDYAYFQSYNTIIAKKDCNTGQIVLDATYWNYSRTTSKYRAIFLNETTVKTEQKIKKGVYKLEDLN